MESSKRKYIIVVRHGERSDYAKVEFLCHKHDPELTQRGIRQAEAIGRSLKDRLLTLFNGQLPKINIFASPFIRTLQTAHSLMTSIYNHSEFEINVKHRLSEWVEHAEHDTLNDFVTLFTAKDFKIFEAMPLVFDTDLDGLPNLPESEGSTFTRTEHFVKHLKDDFVPKNDFEVGIVVTHGKIIENLNEILGNKNFQGFCEVKYCTAYIFEVKEGGETEFVERIYPEYEDNEADIISSLSLSLIK